MYKRQARARAITCRRCITFCLLIAVHLQWRGASCHRQQQQQQQQQLLLPVLLLPARRPQKKNVWGKGGRCQSFEEREPERAKASSAKRSQSKTETPRARRPKAIFFPSQQIQHLLAEWQKRTMAVLLRQLGINLSTYVGMRRAGCAQEGNLTSYTTMWSKQNTSREMYSPDDDS